MRCPALRPSFPRRGRCEPDDSARVPAFLQLYAELLIARFPLLDNSTATAEPDAGVKEAVASIMFAAGRTEVKGAPPPAAPRRALAFGQG